MSRGMSPFLRPFLRRMSDARFRQRVADARPQIVDRGSRAFTGSQVVPIESSILLASLPNFAFFLDRPKVQPMFPCWCFHRDRLVRLNIGEIIVMGDDSCPWLEAVKLFFEFSQ